MSESEVARAAALEHEGVVYEISEADAAWIEQRARGMAGMRRSVVYLRARYKYPQLAKTAAIELAARAIGRSALDLISLLSGGTGHGLLSPAEVTIDGRTWKVEASELELLDSALSTGTWRVAALYPQMKARTGSIDAALALTAQLLGTTVESVRGSLEWHDGYMRMKEGDDRYTIF